MSSYERRMSDWISDGCSSDRLLARQIDVLTVDPLVSSHGLSDENDNSAMDMVAKQWGRIAKAANCAVVLVHHSKKLNGADVTMESSRGASSDRKSTRLNSSH